MSKLKSKVTKTTLADGHEYVLVECKGIISAPTINEFRDSLVSAGENNRNVILDLAEVTYINSTGLGKMVLFSEEQISKGLELYLAGLAPDAFRLVQMLGLTEVLPVCHTVSDAEALIGKEKVSKVVLQQTAEEISKGKLKIVGMPPPRLPDANILIGMPEGDKLAKLLDRALAADNGNLHITDKRDEILALIKKQSIDIAILDDALPQYSQICLDLKTSPDNGLVSIIRVSSGEGASSSDMCVAADEVITDPFAVNELFALATAEYDRCKLESMLFTRELELIFPSTPHAVEEGVAMIRSLVDASPFDELGQEKLMHAVFEAIDNSNRHGNNEDPFKKIRVQFLLDKEKLTLTVTDEGEGFDYKERLELAKNSTPLLETRKIAFEEDRAGLGINIITRCCDSVEYSAPGNSLKITKYF